MRIRTQHFLLGMLLLLGLSSAPEAYTLNNNNSNNKKNVLLHPPYRLLSTATTLGPSRKSSPRPLTNLLLLHSCTSNHKEIPFSTHSVESIAHQPKDVTISDPTTTSTTTTTTVVTEKKETKRNIATWLAVASLFLISQFVDGISPKGTATSIGTTDKGLLYSAVSATFLRQKNNSSSSHNQGKLSKWINVPNLLLTLVVFQAMQQVGHLAKGLITLGGIFSSWYMVVLHQFPLVTKSITAAAIGVMGDTAAQFLEERIRVKKEGRNTKTIEPIHRRYDQRRGLAVLGDSLLISGPLLHIFYELLESAIPVAGPYASLAAMAHVLIDNFVLDALFVAVMFVSTGIAEGYSFKQIIPQMKKDYVNTMKAGWATSIMLMPLLFVCFRFLPLSFRVLGMNIIDIFWEGIISYMVHRRRGSTTESQEQDATTAVIHESVPVLTAETVPRM
ncbi:Mpv17 / PMP22 family protein [Nitzschia inconspicua]|uniref:Mpv17 / PMP22 family protein n=1 Tax=Nitzschia inconspicua TaxID=303405 RepID=A0A9K3M1J8_9STRA|nr:Mpv17 / PMP22 family protein [Nitzschia inconspicua]